MGKSPFFVGIAGGTASGKSTLAQQLLELSPKGTTSVLLVDSYYRAQDHLSMEERAKTNYDHPNSFEFDLLAKHINQLKAGHNAEIPIYDYSTHTRSSKVNLMRPTPIVIVEGILALYPQNLRETYSLSLFVEAPAQTRLERRIKRDVRERGRTQESVLSQWQNTVQPMHDQFCEPTKTYAQEIISGLEVGNKTAEILLDKIMKAVL